MKIDIEKVKMGLLVLACLYMAGLNLWLLFKDWFDERYERKQKKSQTKKNDVKLNERGIPSFVGKTKTDIRFLESIKKEENEVNIEEEFTPLKPKFDATDIHLNGTQSATIDEFELMAQALNGKPISKSEQLQVAETILRTKGTDLFEKMVNQIDGAKQRALLVLRDYATEQEDNTSGSSSNTSFDLGKYINA